VVEPAGSSLATDREALLELAEATGGAYLWVKPPNWGDESDHAKWNGVTVGRPEQSKKGAANRARWDRDEVPDVDAGRVTCVEVREAGLEGPFPTAALAKLSRLRTLDLSLQTTVTAGLEGPLGPGVSQLTRLAVLQLSRNLLSGPLPASVSTMVQLRELDLSWNRFTGPVPPGYGQTLTNLEALNLSCQKDRLLGARGLSGAIPDLSKLLRLEWLFLGGNSLGGTIPESLCGLTLLKHLDLRDNAIKAPLPVAIGLLNMCKVLTLDGNKALASLDVRNTKLLLPNCNNLVLDGTADYEAAGGGK
jgi:hypothetical protein